MSGPIARLLTITAAGAGGGAAAAALDAPAAAVLLCGGIGLIAGWGATRRVTPPAGPSLPAEPAMGDRPASAMLLAAVSDPLLLIERQRVVHANPAARALLGQHIVGEDVRVAIRHPAAAEHLTGSIDATARPIMLAGLGEPGRRWQMSVGTLASGERLIRLTDRTAEHVAERMRVDFVANASHELRTPLATLLGFIETLEDPAAGGDRDTRLRFLGIMQKEAKRMERLLDDLMSLSRIEADRYSPPATRIDLAALATEVRDAIAAGLPDPARLELDLELGLPAIVGDRAQLSQLLHNLIGNAVKYGRADRPVRLTLDRAGGGMVRLAVADEGEGIAQEHLPRLTERFYRVDAGRSRGVGGTGLGLAIVKHIVERHRGRLDIASAVGVGTTVSVLFPAAARPE